VGVRWLSAYQEQIMGNSMTDEFRRRVLANQHWRTHYLRVEEILGDKSIPDEIKVLGIVDYIALCEGDNIMFDNPRVMTHPSD
jgi:hypothetical protein